MVNCLGEQGSVFPFSTFLLDVGAVLSFRRKARLSGWPGARRGCPCRVVEALPPVMPCGTGAEIGDYSHPFSYGTDTISCLPSVTRTWPYNIVYEASGFVSVWYLVSFLGDKVSMVPRCN